MSVPEKLVELLRSADVLYGIIQGNYFSFYDVYRDCSVGGFIKNQKTYVNFCIGMEHLTSDGKNIIEPLLHTLVVKDGRICRELFDVYKRIVEKSNIGTPPPISIFVKAIRGTLNEGVVITFIFSMNSNVNYVLTFSIGFRHNINILFSARDRVIGKRLFVGSEKIEPTSDVKWEQVVERVKRDLSKISGRMPDKDALRMYEVLLNNAGEFIDVLLDWFNRFPRMIAIYRLYP